MQKICERDLILFGFLSRFVLRNHIAQKAIEHAEKGDFSEVIKLNMFPYQYKDLLITFCYAPTPPAGSQSAQTCRESLLSSSRT